MQIRNTLQAASGLTSGLVRIGAEHGYTFDGDQVHLDADLSGASAGPLALQLWACDAPFDGNPVKGTKVAELPVAADQTRISATTTAFPPAGHAAHAMVLVLADSADGSIHDFANFPRPETFPQPRITGSAGFTLGDGQVELHIDGIDNPRAEDNLSGTLTLELWALAAPFGELGNTADGTQLAGTTLGSLSGKYGWSALSLELPLAARPAGTWHIALLLREWTAAGYVTRDFTDFPLPLSWAATDEAAPAEAPKAAPKKADARKAGKAKSEKVEKIEKGDKKAKAEAPAGVSINRASAAELAAVKGLSKTVAAAIVAARPFASVDELLKVKGLGTKLLDKLKGSLSL